MFDRNYIRSSDNNQRRGFTLVETLVALIILMVVLVAALHVIFNSLFYAEGVGDQLTASLLAQDAMEFVHNIRDSNSLSQADWLRNLRGCAPTNNGGAEANPSNMLDGCRADTAVPPSIVDSVNSVGILADQDVPLKYLASASGAFLGYSYADVCSHYFGCGATASDTKFYRKLWVIPQTSSAEVVVVLYVKWKTNNQEKSYTLREVMRDWQKTGGI